MLLIQGARVSEKYGIQLNISADHGKVIINPSRMVYGLPQKFYSLGDPKSMGIQTTPKRVKKFQPNMDLMLQDLHKYQNADQMSIFTVLATPIELLTKFEDVTYLSCPECYSKVHEYNAVNR